MSPLRTAVPALLLLCSAGLTAAETGEAAPGPAFGIANERRVVIRGLLDFDVLNRGQYTTGDSGQSDHQGTGNIRAEFGTGVKLDEKVKVNITLAYEAEAGDNTADSNNPNQRSGFAVVDDAYVDFKDFLGFESLGVMVGRMPVGFNLREGHGSFLYSSAANHPRVTSWDGARATWDISPEAGISATPFAYSVPGASTLFGIESHWQPPRAGDSRLFITGMATWERKVPNRIVDPTSSDSTVKLIDSPAGPGDRLLTYYGGSEFELGQFDIFGEGAMQRGNQTGNIEYSGYGGNAGIDWHAYPTHALVFGVQADYLSGNPEDPTVSGQNRAFVNNWENANDTLIVEHEQYGELSRYLQGNLEAGKLKAGVAFDERNKVRLDAIYAYYRTAQALNGAQKFGQEADLTLTWQYTFNATFRFFGGGFLPGSAYQEAVSAAGLNRYAGSVDGPGRDLIYCLGVNLSVVF